MIIRMRRVGICRRVITALTTPSPSSDHHDNQVNPWEYFINRERKFVWCNVFKSASSSWMYGFNNVAIR